ncbi:vegetative cell wall protein gp1 [Malania oleifera]|uniref:vegetative cell wall protein gp1 n=1 Tax=Malania oleifera TaxID=397392 RepID=UPI0025AE9DE2|nr:vegetative cell wall protein gp1 [Malania oleifera]
MDSANNHLLITISFFSIFLILAQAICLPRGTSQLIHFASEFSHLPPASQPSPASAPSPASNSPLQPPSSSPASSPVSTPSNSPAPSSDFTQSNSPAPSPVLNSPSPSPGTTSPSANFQPLHAQAANPAIKKICDSTDYPEICSSTIAPFLTGKTDALSVLETAIRAVITNARLALAASKSFPAISDSPGLETCNDSYNDALDNLLDSMDSLATKDIGTVNSMLSAVITDIEACIDAFSGSNSPFGIFDEKVKKMTSNCLAIASLVK